MTTHKDTTTIEIDFDVFQQIVKRQKGFSDTPNAVLRRVFKLSSASVQKNPVKNQAETLPMESPGMEGRPWIGKGVELPHGTKVRMEYWGIQHHGIIQDGHWLVKSERVKSPSAAAKIISSGASLNGWVYWSVKLPGKTRFQSLNSLRDRNDTADRA